MTSAGEYLQTVVVVVVVISGLLGMWSLFGMPDLYRRIGRGGLDVPDRIPGPPPGSVQARDERNAELRQLLQARSDVRQERGLTPLDVELELALVIDPPPEAAA